MMTLRVLLPLSLHLLLAVTNLCQARVVKYELNVYYFPGSPDGIHKDRILGINGQFPGPTLEAEVGDTLEVTLINSIQDGQNTTIHWHGIAMKGSLFEDGTSLISQCPLPFGQSMVYRFNVTTPGTFWYHSHVNSQYTEGMFGALLVHANPEAYSYDGEFTIALSDWYHQSAHENEAWHLSAPAKGVPPYPNSGLLNGMGRYPCHFADMQRRPCNVKEQQRQVFHVQRGSTYRLRLISAAAVAAFNFSIDGHTLRTIEVDGVDVASPVEADIVPIAAGQRYSFLVTCDPQAPNGTRYLIRANMRKESLMLIEGENINRYPEALMGDVTGVLVCMDDDDLDNVPNNALITKEEFTCDDVVPPLSGDNFVYLDESRLAPLDGISAPDYVDEEYIVSVHFGKDIEGVRRGSFNATPFRFEDDKPLMMKVLDGERLGKNFFPLEINYGSVVQLVIQNPFYGPHPFHLHGHHFWVLGTGAWFEGSYDPAKHNLTLTGAKRDTVVIQEQSWAVIRFVADNIGVWTFHCHIDWHNLSGMALTFIEGKDILRREVQPTEEALRVCRMHTDRRAAQTDTNHFVHVNN